MQDSEFNPSPSEGVHFPQILIQPDVKGIAPSYEEKRFSAQEKRGRLRLVASPDRAEGSVLIRQDARVNANCSTRTRRQRWKFNPARLVYAHVARGHLGVNGTALKAGDAIQLRDMLRVTIEHGRETEVLPFNLHHGVPD